MKKNFRFGDDLSLSASYNAIAVLCSAALCLISRQVLHHLAALAAVIEHEVEHQLHA